MRDLLKNQNIDNLLSILAAVKDDCPDTRGLHVIIDECDNRCTNCWIKSIEKFKEEV